MSLFHHVIYQPEINWLIRNLNHFLSPVLPDWIKIHPSGTLKVVLKDDGSFYLKTNQTSFLTRELFWKKAEKFEYTPVFIDLIKKTGTFFDVGANIGYYSILGCKVNPGLKVYAFEPSPGVMRYLSENIAINHFGQRIIPENIALSDAQGEIDFYEMKNPKFPATHNLSGEHNIGTKPGRLTRTISVSATTLDEYSANHGLRELDMIKLDTEGAESLILKGAEKSLRKFRPIVICETLFNKIEKELEEIMKQHGYGIYNHCDNGLQEVSTIIRTEDDGVRNCFFVPESKRHFIEGWLR